MKNPYDTLQANHTAPYHVWEAAVFLDQASYEMAKAIKEMQRSQSAFGDDAIEYLAELKDCFEQALERAEKAECYLLELWEDHHSPEGAKA
jgi:hypothetical protein